MGYPDGMSESDTTSTAATSAVCASSALEYSVLQVIMLCAGN